MKDYKKRFIDFLIESKALQFGEFVTKSGRNTPFFVNLWTKFLGNFTSTWLGIILQLVLIPALLLALKKGGILVKYTDDKPEQTVQQTSEVH